MVPDVQVVVYFVIEIRMYTNMRVGNKGGSRLKTDTLLQLELELECEY